MADDDRTSGLRLAGVGMEFAAAVAGLSLAGYWIDRHYGSEPWGVLAGAALGLIGGTYNLIRQATAKPAGKDGAGGPRGGGDPAGGGPSGDGGE
jgi:F0F1-type ATP synthase assembly protein I